jgi:hypothetical protein
MASNPLPFPGRSQPSPSQNIMRQERWRTRILRWFIVSAAFFILSLVLFVVVLVTSLVPEGDRVYTLALDLLIATIIFFGAMLFLLLVNQLFFGKRYLRKNLGPFLQNPEIPLEQKRSAFDLIRWSNWHPSTTEEKIWYYILNEQWQDLYPFGRAVIPPLLGMLQTIFLSPEEIRSTQGRLHQIGELFHFNGEEGIQALLDALSSGDQRLVANVALILGYLREKQAVPSLLQLLSNDTNSQEMMVLQRTLHALGEIGDPRAVRPMIELVYGGNEVLRATATQSLRAMGELLLAEAIQTETDPRIRLLIRTFLDSVTQRPSSERRKKPRGTRTLF